MKQTLPRLIALKRLTTAESLSANSTLAALHEKEKRLRANLTNLNAQKRLAAQSKDAAAIAGAHIRWQKWADEKRAVINVELAAILGQKAAARAKAKRAFGKDQALSALVDRETKLKNEWLERRLD